jgi:CubicO group peptidase (beta-lactamase class C family)
MLKTRVFCLSLCLILTAGAKLRAQALPDPIVKKINSLFRSWDNTQSPGCVVGIVRNDTLIFSKGYGMANLEYAIPNSPETIYHLASVSKQFTAYAIVLLAQQGKLNLDDDIRKYLPWFPNLKQKISIRNLLNHTSGIRDQWQLLGISGTRIDDVITQEHIIKILSKQKGLNFNPGDKFVYSNSGYTLLAEIVKSISGQSLRKFTDSAIFKPLGMVNTHFHDDYTGIEKNRAYSYDRKDNTRFSNSILSYSTVGPTSLFSNINDLAKWVMNFYDTRVGNQQSILQLTQKGRLNDGTELDYAAGIISANYKSLSKNGST